MYTTCYVCKGVGYSDFKILNPKCLVCKGRGKVEKFITLEELRSLLKLDLNSSTL